MSVYGRLANVLFAYVLGRFANVLQALHVVSITSCKSFFK